MPARLPGENAGITERGDRRDRDLGAGAHEDLAALDGERELAAAARAGLDAGPRRDLPGDAIARSFIGTPSFSYVASNSGSTSSKLLRFGFGAE